MKYLLNATEVRANFGRFFDDVAAEIQVFILTEIS